MRYLPPFFMLHKYPMKKLNQHPATWISPRVVAASLDRHNGSSLAPYDSLNVSLGVGDTPETVLANRQLIKQTLNIPQLISARQIHGDQILILDQPLTHEQEFDGYDALITNQADLGLMIQQADCQAVLLHDPLTPSVAAIHCGWRGSVLNIIDKTIRSMMDTFHTDPTALRAYISPSLGPCCAEFINYRSELPPALHRFQARDNHFDFRQISHMQLTSAGVRPENIDQAGICTACSPDYFSYRRACRSSSPLQGITGRNGSIIALR